MTSRWRNRESAAVISSTRPSIKRSCSGSAERLANGKTSMEVLSRDDAAIPDAGDQIVPANDAAATPDKMKQDTEDLRFNRDKIGSPPQFVSVGIERVCFEPVDHLQPHRWVILKMIPPNLRENQDYLNAGIGKDWYAGRP